MSAETLSEFTDAQGWVYAERRYDDGDTLLWAFDPEFAGRTTYFYPWHEGTDDPANSVARRMVERAHVRCAGTRMDGLKCRVKVRERGDYCHAHAAQGVDA
jgi:hypothetical protein